MQQLPLVLDAAVDALLSAANKDLELEAVRDFMELGNAYLAALHEESEAEPLTSDEVDKYAQRQAELLTAGRFVQPRQMCVLSERWVQ